MLQIVFDECHRAKNLVQSGSQKSSKTGQVVLELQKLLPKARVVYASATGATGNNIVNVNYVNMYVLNLIQNQQTWHI
jgi:hypothetical protein